jgi:hypothetical protein
MFCLIVKTLKDEHKSATAQREFQAKWYTGYKKPQTTIDSNVLGGLAYPTPLMSHIVQ